LYKMAPWLLSMLPLCTAKNGASTPEFGASDFGK